MKQYHLDILIHNDHGELLDKRISFPSMADLNFFMTDPTSMHKLWSEAAENGHEDGMLYEEIFDSKEAMELAMDNGLTSDDMVNN